MATALGMSTTTTTWCYTHVSHEAPEVRGSLADAAFRFCLLLWLLLLLTNVRARGRVPRGPAHGGQDLHVVLVLNGQPAHSAAPHDAHLRAEEVFP